MSNKILILDFGSQFTQLIARRARELGYFSFILPGTSKLDRIRNFDPGAIILSGGPASTYEAGSPQLDPDFWNYRNERNLPVLGVCYGMQLMVRHFGGSIEPALKREYGRMAVDVLENHTLFEGIRKFEAWMSHGDETTKIPPTFQLLAKSAVGAVASIAHPTLPICGIQFHPEVAHTEQGTIMLKNFFSQCAKLTPDWKTENIIESHLETIRSTVPNDAHVICGLSGGVDSTVAATLVHRALGDRLHCIFVDTGLLRFEEGNRVMKLFTEQLHLPVTRVDASERFLKTQRGYGSRTKAKNHRCGIHRRIRAKRERARSSDWQTPYPPGSRNPVSRCSGKLERRKAFPYH